jgi:hypothetical protein
MSACRAPSPRRGFTVVEMTIALTGLAVLLLLATAGLKVETGLLRGMASTSVTEVRVQDALQRLEKELAFARGERPIAILASGLGGGGSTATVASTARFPDEGWLLLSRGTAAEERVFYATSDASTFVGLDRGQQCTDGVAHAAGSEVLWSGLAEPVANQTNPPASQFDGRALGFGGATFFRGDGTGFSYCVPTDPAGGTNYFDGEQITWGATVNGTPTLSGRSAIYFAPLETLTEANANADLNRDGDRLDTFDVGQLRRRSWDESNPDQEVPFVALCPTMLLQERCNWGGDLDGDGFDDPLFLWNETTRQLDVRLFVMVRGDGGTVRVRRARTTIFLRNATTP